MAELSKSKFNIYASLGSAKMRRKHGLFSVEGERSVADSIGSFKLEALICTPDYETPFDIDCEKVMRASVEQMSKLSNLSTSTSVMAIFELPEKSEDNDSKLPEGLYLVLDGVQDPGNLGTIIRTCHWFGIKRVFASKDTVDIFNPKTIQSTMGSLGKVSVTYCNILDLFDANRDLPVYGTLLEGEDIFHTELGHTGFIVMGNEGNGLSKEVRGKISKPLFIPPKNKDDHSESLNVAVASAIVLAMFQR